MSPVKGTLLSQGATIATIYGLGSHVMFLMKHQEGMTCEEIADTMGTSVGTVKKTLFRVVDRLRQHFAMPAIKG